MYENEECGQTPSTSAVHSRRKAFASTRAGRSVRIGAGRGGKDERRSSWMRVTRADLRGAFWNSRRGAHSHHVSGKKNHLCILPREPARRVHGSGHRASGKSGSRRCGTAGGGRERRCFDAVWPPRTSHNPRGRTLRCTCMSPSSTPSRPTGSTGSFLSLCCRSRACCTIGGRTKPPLVTVPPCA